MLTKSQASQVADELIAQQRKLMAEQHDARTPRVSFLYRCPEIASLTPRQQAAMLHRAKSIVFRERMIHISAFVLFATVLLAWWVSNGQAGVSGQVMTIFACAAAAVTVLRVLIVRLVVRVLAGQHANNIGGQADGSAG